MIRAVAISLGAACLARDPAEKKHPANTKEQAEIEADPREPDQTVDSGIGIFRRLVGGGLADGKGDRARHGVAILRDHAVADDLCALGQISRQRDVDRLVLRFDRRIGPQLARGIDQIDRAGGDAFIEPQLNRLRRLRQHRAVTRLGESERGVRRRLAGKAHQQQQRREKAHQGFVSFTPGAGHLPSCEWVAPSGGISIQRLTPCSHSCTTGK